MGSLSRLTLTAAICAYSIWFWFSLEPSPSSTACPAYIFILAKADVCHGTRFFFRTILALCMVPLGVSFIWEIVLVAWFYFTTITATILLVFGFSIYETRRGNWWNSKKGLKFAITKGPRLALALSWARANKKRSTGPERPDLAPSVLYCLKCIKRLSFIVVGRLLSRITGREVHGHGFSIHLIRLRKRALKIERYGE